MVHCSHYEEIETNSFDGVKGGYDPPSDQEDLQQEEQRDNIDQAQDH